MERTPVVVLTGHLGSGKTTLLNYLLRRPGARVGVIVNDFGSVNVDAALVSGQVDEPASIAGGCICCLPDAGGLDEALAKLSHPRLALDVVIVEASGLAEPATLARLVRSSPVDRIRPGGVVEVVDAVEYFSTLDSGVGPAPVRFDVATLVVVNKVDRASDTSRIVERIRTRNPHVAIVPATRGRIDPALVYDAAAAEDPPDQLPFGEALRAEQDHHVDHVHADATTVSVPGSVEPAGVLDLLGDPPPSAYRIKGTVLVGGRGYVLNVVGRWSHLAPAKTTGTASELVAIGLHLDVADVRRRLERALRPTERPSPDALREFRRHVG